MPRRRSAELVDQELPLDLDPAPAAARTRAPRKAAAVKATGTRGKIPARTPTGRVMSKAQMQAKVRDEVVMYLGLVHGGWDLRDPECASVVDQDRLDVIADRVTSMIARSDSLLEMASKTGIIGDIVGLLNALFPVAKAIWRAHGPGGHGHGPIEEREHDYAAQYPAYPGVAR